MRQTQLFTKIKKDAPKDETAINAQLLIRGGYIHKELAGAYTYLPLGLRVIKKIEQVIREEMNAIGGQEVQLTALQDKKLWEKTNRWSDDVIDVWFKTKLKNDTELGLAPTHEEPLTALLTEHIQSYRDLPCSVYQFQTKFRNELRAKSGILRGREFLMKDLYSFSRTQAEHDAFYERATAAYLNIFSRVGLGETTTLTYASGGSFSAFSHEFQTITESGEDIIYLAKDKKLAVNKEVYTPEVLESLGLTEGEFVATKAIEVGNIFSLGTRFSDALGLTYVDETGKRQPVIMGCYGIGIGRVMGTIAEIHHDDRGLVWPAAVAPFTAHLLVLGEDETVRSRADAVYADLTAAGIEVLYDDRPTVTAGQKFAEADVLGLPWRLVISTKTGEQIELKARSGGEAELVALETARTRLQS